MKLNKGPYHKSSDLKYFQTESNNSERKLAYYSYGSDKKLLKIIGFVIWCKVSTLLLWEAHSKCTLIVLHLVGVVIKHDRNNHCTTSLHLCAVHRFAHNCL